MDAAIRAARKGKPPYWAKLIERKQAPDAPLLSDTETDALKRAERLLQAVTALAEVHVQAAISEVAAGMAR